MIVILFGPTGVGKTSIMRVLCRDHGYKILRSVTTRPPRQHEDDRSSVSRREFGELVANNTIVATSQLFGHRYAINHADLEAARKESDDLYVIDFALENAQDILALGGRQIGFLVMPPNEKALKSRLKERGRQDRVQHAVDQLETCRKKIREGLPSIISDRVVVNDDLPVTTRAIVDCVTGILEKQKTSATSVLTDDAIRLELSRGGLFSRGTWTSERIHQCSYGLRLDSRVLVSDAQKEASTGQREYTQRDMADGQALELKPGDSALLYTAEVFELPANMMAITIPRGVLVAQSLSPGASYVDPGFGGSFCIPVTNNSNRIIRLQTGIELARAIFLPLGRNVSEPWSSADATSLRESVEGAPSFPSLSRDRLKKMRLDELFEMAQTPANNQEIARQMFLRFQRYFVLFFAVCVIWPTMLWAFTTDAVQSSLGGLFKGGTSSFFGAIVTTVVATFLVFLISRMYQKAKGED